MDCRVVRGRRRLLNQPARPHHNATRRQSWPTTGFSPANGPSASKAQAWRVVGAYKALAGWLEPADLHEQTVAEIRVENPEAGDREVRLGVAIRESMGMTRDEEDAAFAKIRAALQS